MQNYRDPPPYPGHSKQVFTNQPGFRQSFSGSETSTDVSLSSTENLATSQRQEPQGEETQTSLYNQLDLGNTDGCGYSILARLGMTPGALESASKLPATDRTLSTSTISAYKAPSAYGDERSPIHPHQSRINPSMKSEVGHATPVPALYSPGKTSSSQWHGNSHGGYSHLHSNEGRNRVAEFMSSSSSSMSHTATDYSSLSSSASTLTMMSRGGGGGGKGTVDFSSYSTSSSRVGLPPGTGGGGGGGGKGDGSGSGSGGGGSSSNILSTTSSSSSLSSHQYLSPRVAPVSTYHHPHPYVNAHWTVGSGDSTSSCHTPPLTYQTGLPPPPEYPGDASNALHNSSLTSSEKGADIRSCRSYETMDKVNGQHSLQDLRLCASSPGIYMHDPKYQASSPSRSQDTSGDEGDLQASMGPKACRMVEMLTEHNRGLRAQLAISAVKVAKLQKFELEIQKVHESHEALVKSSQKREALWQAMKRKLEERVQALTLQCAGVKDDGASSVHSEESSQGKEHRMMLAEKDAMISKLLSQNQDLSSAKDQLQGENAQMSLALTEHQAHVDILENALLNAQSKVLTLEEECRKEQAYAGTMEQLQGALNSLQTVSEKKEKNGQEMPSRLERELDMYRQRDKSCGAVNLEPGKDEGKNVAALRKMLEERDARILHLESELARQEQKHVKETALRQLNMEEGTEPPKEVRLAALGKSSADMEQLIEEAKTEKLKHMEELHQSQLKVAELEAKVKQLQTQLVEKEAMVKVFQRSPLAMARSTSLHALCHSPLHSPRPSLITPHAGLSSGAGVYREFSNIRHMKTGSTSAIELGRKTSMEEDILYKVQSLGAESKSDTEDEVKLWHV